MNIIDRYIDAILYKDERAQSVALDAITNISTKHEEQQVASIVYHLSGHSPHRNAEKNDALITDVIDKILTIKPHWVNQDISFGGETPLIIAISKNRPKLVSLLIASGADIGQKNPRGESVGIHLTASKLSDTFQVPILDEILAHHPTTENERCRMLLYSSGLGHFNVASLLMKHQADGPFLGGGRTPVHTAALRGHVAAIETLRDVGANFSLADKEGNTALHQLMMEPLPVEDKLKIAKIAIEQGCSVLARDQRGRTVIEIANRAKMKELGDLMQIYADAERLQGATPPVSRASGGIRI